MIHSKKETLVGALVVVAGGLFIAYTTGSGAANRRGGEAGYRVTAQFNRTDGLGVGGAVRLAGLPVGSIVDQTLTDTFRTVVTLAIRSEIKLPKDSAALIQSDGLLGSKYIELQPGGSEQMIGPDERLAYTQDSLIVDDLLARILAQAKSRAAHARDAAQTKPACAEPAVGDKKPDGAGPGVNK